MIILKIFSKIYEYLQDLIYLCVLLPLTFILRNEKFKKFVKYKSGEEFAKNVALAKSNLQKLKPKYVCWVHVSSAGELEQFKPVAEVLHEKYQTYFFITFFSPSAEPFLKKIPGLIGSSGFPLDKKNIFQIAFDELNISCLVFVRYDLWPNLVLAGQEKNVSIFLTSGTSMRAKKFAFTIAPFLLKKFSHIFCINESDLSYFKSLNTAVTLSGDPKWERVKNRAYSFSNLQIDKWDERLVTVESVVKHAKNQGKDIIVMGSPHKEELNCILDSKFASQNKMIILVPHEVSQNAVQNLKENFRQKTNLKVQLLSDKRDAPQHDLPDVLVVDSIGILAEVYKFADVCVVGGGFDGQIHNILEPAAYHKLILVGKNLTKAPEAEILQKQSACLSFETEEKMKEFLLNFSSRDLVNQASTKKLIDNLKNIFKVIPAASQIISERINQTLERKSNA